MVQTCDSSTQEAVGGRLLCLKSEDSMGCVAKLFQNNLNEKVRKKTKEEGGERGEEGKGKKWEEGRKRERRFRSPERIQSKCHNLNRVPSI